MTIGTFGTITIDAVKSWPKRSGKSHKANTNARFKCSKCTVKSDDEDVLITHVMSVNECKAQFYTDGGV